MDFGWTAANVREKRNNICHKTELKASHIFIEFCCDAAFSISHLNGREKMRYGMLFDAILNIEGNEVFYEADECFWHSCPKLCHLSEANVIKGHKLRCDACRTDEMVGNGSAHLKFLKP